MDSDDKIKLLKSLLFPAVLLFILWAVKIIEVSFTLDFSDYGIYPQHLKGLRGIVFSPLLHSDFKHLSANSLPLFLLTAGLFYFYDKASLQIFVLSWIITGFWVWIFAKDTGIHIGASGVVYALAGFHFTGGLIRRNPGLSAFALLIVFLYGGLVWGVFPQFFPEQPISWESHLLGILAGVILALFYRETGPQPKQYEWDDDEEEPETELTVSKEVDGEYPQMQLPQVQNPTSLSTNDEVKIVYHRKPGRSTPEKE